MFLMNGQEKGMFFKHIKFLEKGLFFNAVFYDGYQFCGNGNSFFNFFFNVSPLKLSCCPIESFIELSTLSIPELSVNSSAY